MRLLCIACHHLGEITPLPRNAKPYCKDCGSRAIRRLNTVNVHQLNGGQIDSAAARQSMIGALRSIGRERGYKNGYANAMYREVFLAWPDGLDGVVPCNPTTDLLWWVRQRGIAYAKAHFPREKPMAKPVEEKSALMSDDDWENL
jgi:hypothetical protein